MDGGADVTDSRPPHRDYSRTPTRPGLHVDPLAATVDDAIHDYTPVGLVAERIAANVRAGLTSEEILAHDRVIEALAMEMSQQLAEQRARMLAAQDERPRRLAELEAKVVEHEAKHLRLTGMSETNGRLGTMDRTIAKLREDMEEADAAQVDANAAIRVDLGTSDERREEKAANRLVRRAGLKLAAIGGAALLAIGASVRVWLTADRAATAKAALIDYRLRALESAAPTPTPKATP